MQVVFRLSLTNKKSFSIIIKDYVNSIMKLWEESKHKYSDFTLLIYTI